VAGIALATSLVYFVSFSLLFVSVSVIIKRNDSKEP